MNSHKNRRFTLIEMLVVIAIISILFSLLLPTLKQSQSIAQSVFCLSNLKQLSLVMHNYAADYNGWALSTTYGSNFMFGPMKNDHRFNQTLCPYLEMPPLDSSVDLTQYEPAALSVCPSGRRDGTGIVTTSGMPNFSYGYNTYLVCTNTPKATNTSDPAHVRFGKLTSVRRPSIRAFCSDITTNAVSLSTCIEFPARHIEGADNIVFVDGHAESWDYFKKLDTKNGSEQGGMNGFWHDATW